MYVSSDHGTYQTQNRDLDLWDATLCHWASDSQCFEGSYCLHLQDQAAQEEAFGFFLDCLIRENKDTMILQNV